MSKQVLLEKLLRKREQRLDLVEAHGDQPAKGIKFRRPSESEMHSMLVVVGDKATWSVGIEHVRKCVFDWYGFTEAELLGADMAPPDPVAFDAELWDIVVSDRADWVSKIADAILEAVVKHVNERDTVRKN